MLLWPWDSPGKNAVVDCHFLSNSKCLLSYPHTPKDTCSLIWQGVSDGSDGKESACNEGDPGSIPGSGRFPGEGNIYSVFFIYPEHKSFVRCVLWLFSPSLWLAFSLSWWCCYFFLKCLVESISEAIWVWSLYKILNYRLNEQNEIGFPLPTSVSVVIFKGYFSFPLSCLIY